MYFSAFIHVPNPTRVRVVERERDEGEPRVLEMTFGRTIPLLPIAPDHADSDLEASVNRLFDECGFGRMWDLLARSMLSAESGAEVATTLPFVTSSISATPKHDSGVPTAPERFVISSDSSHHSANASEVEGSSIIRCVVIPPMVGGYYPQVARIPSTATLEPSTKVVTSVHASLFQDSNSAGTVRPDVAGSSYAPEGAFIRVSGDSSHHSANASKVEGSSIIRTVRPDVAGSSYAPEGAFIRAMENSLCDEVTALKGRNAILEKERDALDGKLKVVNDKLKKLYADFVDMALHLEEIFYPRLLTTIFDRRWLLTHGMELAVTKCLHSSEYLSALRAAIGKAIEKQMQDGLAVKITHGANGRTLANVAAYNPSAEADYVFAMQRLQNINFSLLAELRSSKDVSVDTIMNILCLEDNLVERENIASQRPALRDVFIPISEPFSAEVLTGTGGTSDAVPAPITTALSITLDFSNTVAPITIDDADVDPLPNVDDGELNMPYALLFPTRSTSALLSVGMPISAGMTASVLYVNENGVSSLLDLIIVRLRFALSMRPLVCVCLMEAKLMVATGFASIHFVKQSMATIKNLTFPEPSGKGPSMSIPYL
nr:hypothetical protein [Tanacetum cinerariifolium]